MQKRYAIAVAGALAIAAICHAQASENVQNVQTGGTVCGRVAAPSAYILQLHLSPTHDNVIIARSARDEVHSTVNIDGYYCFTGLKDNVYTLTAFGDSYLYTGSVTPILGKTVRLDLFAQPSIEDIGPAGTLYASPVKP